MSYPFMPKNRFASLLLLAVLMIVAPEMAGAQDFDESGYRKGGCANICAAMDLCAELPLAPLEGIWEYPADEVKVLILRDKLKKGHYNVYIVEAVDCRFFPGMRVGYAVDSSDPKKFKLALCSKIKKGVPGSYINCLAQLNESAETLNIEAPKVNVKLAPSISFPALWNKLRLGLRFSTSNPLEKLPEGWVRVYPSYDGNGTSSSRPRYL